MADPTILSQYCLVEDFDAVTQVCSAPFYGPVQAGLPPLSVEDGLLISAAIGGAWAIGFMIRQSRKTVST